MFKWAPRAAERGIELSPAEKLRETRERPDGPMRSELGVHRMKLAAVCSDKTQGRGEEDVRMQRLLPVGFGSNVCTAALSGKL